MQESSLLPIHVKGTPPNIVLILADDMGVGEVSHHGGLVPTPALDQMAAEGMRFTDAHTSSSVCTPTRYGILTGRYNWRSRLKSGVLTAVNSAALIDSERLSLPRFLQEAGYHTRLCRKMAPRSRLGSTSRGCERKEKGFRILERGLPQAVSKRADRSRI